MSPIVSVAVMHVPGSGRDEHVSRILAALPAEWVVVVVEDPTRMGAWPTAKRAWAARPAESTHHVVLQDDAVLCDHFVELLVGAIEARPEAVMSLCARARDAVDAAVLTRCSWFHSPDNVFGQGIVMPTAWIDDFLSWVAQCVDPEFEHDDGRVGMWANATHRGIYTPVPQLVRHAEGPSIMGHPRASGLGTPLFAADRRDVNWNTDAYKIRSTVFGNRGLRAKAPKRVVAALSPFTPPRTTRVAPSIPNPHDAAQILRANAARRAAEAEADLAPENDAPTEE